MTFQPESFAPAAEIVPDRDITDVLRSFAKSARSTRKRADSYPRRTELLAILADAGARIDRINASSS